MVDDDPQVRSALVRVLESQGLACLEAENGEAALALLDAHGELALCLTDIHMPGMDGVSFLREVRHRYPDMAVVMLTAVADVATAVE